MKPYQEESLGAAYDRMLRNRGRKPTPENFTQRQLELFAIRCSELADRVVGGNLSFIDAVDMAYSAADFAGLVEVAGDDAIQKIMFAAFSRGA